LSKAAARTEWTLGPSLDHPKVAETTASRSPPWVKERTVSEDKSPLIKAATSEHVLLGWRAVIGLMTTAAAGMGGIGLTWLSDIKSSQTSLKTEFQAYQLGQEARVGRLEGEVNGIKGSVLVHRDRLIGLEGDMRTVWQRLYDTRTAPTTRGTP
jgi:hypothetical protein